MQQINRIFRVKAKKLFTIQFFLSINTRLTAPTHRLMVLIHSLWEATGAVRVCSNGYRLPSQRYEEARRRVRYCKHGYGYALKGDRYVLLAVRYLQNTLAEPAMSLASLSNTYRLALNTVANWLKPYRDRFKPLWNRVKEKLMLFGYC